MTQEGQLRVLIKLLIGAFTESEAAEALDVPLAEVRRLRSEIAEEGATLVPISANLKLERFEVLDLRGETFREPFFRDSVKRAKQAKPRRLNFEVDLEDFLGAAQRHDHPPDGLLFHVGRCGSTLLANMFSASGEHVVIKEPDLVNNLISEWLLIRDQAARKKIEMVLAAAIRYLLGVSAAIGAEYGTRYRVLKLSSWNICVGRVLLELFPETRAVFLYRSPIETIASLLFQRPGWFDLIDRPLWIQARFFPTLREMPAPLSPITLFAHAWRSAAEAALALPAERLLVINYEALVLDSEATIRRVLSHFRHPVDTMRIETSVARTATYAKDPAHRVRFDPRGEHRRPPLSSEQADEVLAITADLWDQLDKRARLVAISTL